MKNLLKILAPILFDVEFTKFSKYVKGLASLPFDRHYCVLTYPDGRDKPPHCPYIGGEKYVLIPNNDILMPLIEVLKGKFKDIRARVQNIDNQVFTVDFYEVLPDRIKVGYLAPTIRIVNSYNGKIKATAKAGLVWIHRNKETGKIEEEILNNGGIHYVFKHHSDEGHIKMTEIAKQVDEILAGFGSVKSQIERLEKIKVTEVLSTLHEIVPDAKAYPKKAIPLALELVTYDSQVFGTEPNLWLLYTALAQAVKKNESTMDDYQKDMADSVAWANVLEYAELRPKKKAEKKK